mgnify:CR=1 FL=1
MEIMDTNINKAVMEKYELIMNSLKQDEERIMFCETKVRERWMTYIGRFAQSPARLITSTEWKRMSKNL